MNNSGDYGYGGFGEDQYSDYYSTYENYSSSRGSLPGSYPKAQGFGGAQQTGFGTPQPLFGTGSKNSGSRPLLDTPTGFGTQSGFGNPQPLFGTGSGFGEKSKPNDSAKPKPLFGIETGFGVKPKQIGFGTETGFGVKPKKIGFGTPQPLFGTGTEFGVQQKQIGFGTPQPLFGINTGFGTGFSAIEVEQWQKYDGKKRTLTGLAIGGSRSVAKKAKRNNESKIKLIYGRDASFGTTKYNPSMVIPEENEKDDNTIKVDKILTNKKFNFWNLPAKAKVLLISNIPMNVANPRFLFNLLCFYGDVFRIKILHRKKDVALIEFSKATSAAIARDNLDGFIWCGQKLVVSFARYDCIKPPLEAIEAKYYQNFEVPEYKMMHRFSNEEVARTHLLRIVKPCQYVHVANVPAGKSSGDIASLFAEAGLKVLDFLGYKFIPSRKSLIEATATGKALKVRAMVSVKLESASDAALAMAYFNGKYSSIESPEGIRVSFSSTTTESEKTKEIKGWTSVPSYEKFE